MNGEQAPLMIHDDDERVVALTRAIQRGDLDALAGLLATHPGLARANIGAPGKGTKTALIIVTDWPGYFPNGPEVVKLLIGAGADPSAPLIGSDGTKGETPLHYAASSDDVDVAVALVDAGADIDAPGGSITGSPLANACGYGCWHVARLLEARGARIGELWEAAALGNRPRVDELLAADPPPTAADIDEAFWQACHGGQRRMAEYLLDRGANINATLDYAHGTPLDVAAQPDCQEQILIDWLRERGATTVEE